MRYAYDAWGNITYKTGSMADINPFRYRGYYYDTETGFYYLQTRYYDPTICRFINADNYELVAELSQTVGQLNLYAYANNNPIMLTDETGEGFFLASFLIGLFVGAGVGALSAAAEGENIVAGAIIGGVSGGIIGGFNLGFWGTAVIGTATNIISDSINNKKIDVFDSMLSGLIAGTGSIIDTHAIGLVNNTILANFSDEAFSNMSAIILESFLDNVSLQIARHRYNPFSFKIGITQFY